MRWKPFLTPIQSSLNADEAEAFLSENSLEQFTLLDVRQPQEYEAGHIPGAQLVPVGDLFKRMSEIDPEKPVLVYCAIGGRSRIAAQMLAEEGYGRVYDLTGGFKAWNKERAVGSEDIGLDLFSGKESPAETLVVAYGLEAGLRDFYLSLMPRITNTAVQDLFGKLSVIEEKHQRRIFDEYRKILKTAISRDEFEKTIVSSAMEGGLTTEEYLNLYQPDLETPVDAISLAMGIEAQALDLYHRAALRAEAGDTRDELMRIADEERHHLDRLAELFNDF